MIFDFFSSRFDGLLREFREALTHCRDLYVSAGEACVQEHPHLIKKNASDFVRMMDDLHRGLTEERVGVPCSLTVLRGRDLRRLVVVPRERAAAATVESSTR